MDAAPSPPLPKMTPPLIEAVCTGDQDLVELLLEHRASLAARDVAYGAPPSRSDFQKASFALSIATSPTSCGGRSC